MKSNVSLLRRLGAITYDIFLAFSLVFFVAGVIIIIFFDAKAQGDTTLFYIVTIPTTYLYFSLSWVKGRQTLGMKALKFQIVQQNGENITHKQALTRLFCAAITLIFIGHLYMFFNDGNLSLQDKISKTLFVKN